MVDQFDRAENEFFRLKERLAAGRITREQFETDLRALMIQDSQGRRWMLGMESGKWYVHDGRSWIEAQPPSQSPRAGIPSRSMMFIVTAPIVLGILCLGGLIAVIFGADASAVRRSTGYASTPTIAPVAMAPLTSTSTPGLTSTPVPVRRESPPYTAATTALPTQTAAPSPVIRLPAVTPTRTRTPAPPDTTVAFASFGCPGAQGDNYFFDDFSNPQSGWTPYRGVDYQHYYENGEFHFGVSKLNFVGNAWLLLRDLGTNYRIDVQARRSSGPELNDYGLLFAGQNDTTYYSFLVSDVGSYRVVKWVEGQRNDITAWVETAWVNRTGPNHLGVRIENTRINFCLNGQVVKTFTDPALKSGRVGLIGGAFDEPAHIHFDDFDVWKVGP